MDEVPGLIDFTDQVAIVRTPVEDRLVEEIPWAHGSCSVRFSD
jgi:hypothetical protein